MARDWRDRTLRQRYLAHPEHGPLPSLLLALTVFSGLVDAVTVLQVSHTFVANMTGNVVVIGLSLAGAPGFSLGASLAVFAGFVVGLLVSTRLLEWRAPDRAAVLWSGTAAQVVLVSGVVVVGAFTGIGPGRAATPVLGAVLAVAMGIQNATVQRLAMPEFTTTVVTTTLARLANDLRVTGIRGEEAEYRASSVVGLFVGATIGALLVLNVFADAALGLGLAVLVVVAVVAHRGAQGRASWRLRPQP